MYGKIISIVLVALAFAPGPANACKGLNKLLEDDFSNPGSGWLQQAPKMAIKGGKLQLTTEPMQHSSASFEGDLFNNADACVTVTAPDVKDESIGIAGLMFYLTNKYEFYVFAVSPAVGKAGVLRIVDGEFLTPVEFRAADGIKTGGNSVNTLRVTWNNGSVSTYINDHPFATFNARPPKNGKIGLYAESSGATWAFTQLLLTDVP